MKPESITKSSKSKLPGGSLNLVIAGVGGQGNILFSELLAKAAIESGFRVSVSETYGAAQRGGAINSHIRITTHAVSPVIPEGQCDILIAFEPMEAVRAGAKYLSKRSLIVLNSHPLLPTNVLAGEVEYPDLKEIQEILKGITPHIRTLDATNIAIDLKEIIVMNTVMLGALFGTQTLPISVDVILQVLKERLPQKVFDLNRRAFQLGYETTFKKTIE
ncbi:MAG: indolepyruvate oxidoreductase subunit beta [Candidatus Ranarchaeia archaeon]|jgi:indolepyruvate ferredoxin oxidoreductase beta subunit